MPPLHPLRRAVMMAGIGIACAVQAAAQDVRGLEHCSAEKNLERRTSCLQSNTEFLQQALQKSSRELQEKISGAAREITAFRAEIAALKERLAAAQAKIDELQKAQKPDRTAK